jgi:hypothetical protein
VDKLATGFPVVNYVTPQDKEKAEAARKQHEQKKK